MAGFEPWLPCVRVEPRVQLEYRNPVLLRDQYTVEECEKQLSNSGPAAENEGNVEESV